MSLKSSKKVDTNRYELEITIDSEKFCNAINTVYKRERKNISVPGSVRARLLSVLLKNIMVRAYSLKMHLIFFMLSLSRAQQPKQVFLL